MAARIRDVARLAGVSPAAVSFVLNGRDDQLSAETVRRVRAAIDALDYRPSAIARGLARQKTGNIGVLVTHLRHPVQNFIVSALVVEARRHGINVIISDEVIHAQSRQQERTRIIATQIERLIDQRVDGLLASPPLQPKDLTRLARAKIPVVAFDRAAPEMDSVLVDFAQGSYLAVRHLLALGRRALLYLGSSDPALQRGMAAALAEWPGARIVQRVFDIVKPLQAYHAVREALERGAAFDAVFVASDWFAIGVYRALQQAGRVIGRDVAVVGFDDTFAHFFTPALTTISQPFDQIAAHAFRALQARMAGSTDPPQAIHVPPRLMVRASCGAQAANAEPWLTDVWERDLGAGT